MSDLIPFFKGAKRPVCPKAEVIARHAGRRANLQRPRSREQLNNSHCAAPGDLFRQSSWENRDWHRMDKQVLTLGHSPDPDDAFMFYGLAKNLIPTHGYKFEHILQDIQTLNERATRGELDITAISIHAYAYVSDKYALLPSGASMGDGYGPMLVAKQKFSREEVARKKSRYQAR